MFDILLAAAITHMGATQRQTSWMQEPPPRALLRIAATVAVLGGLLAALELGAAGTAGPLPPRILAERPAGPL